MGNLDIGHLLRVLPGIVIGFTVHEFMHAYAAVRLGDASARDDGRLTLNPLRHIDPMGFIMLVLAGFGWARPVRIDPTRFSHPRRDEVLVALAGPFSNLVLAAAFTLALAVAVGSGINPDNTFAFELANVLLMGVYMNLGLFVFNMIPLPPLDGSHIYLPFVKGHNPALAMRVYRYGTLLLLGVILIEQFTDSDILPIGWVVRRLAGVLLSGVGL